MSAQEPACWCGGATHRDDGVLWCYENINHDPTPLDGPECRICNDEIATCPQCDPDHARDVAMDR